MTKDQIAQAKKICKRFANRFETASELAEHVADILNIHEELEDPVSDIWLIAFENFTAEER